MSYGFDANSFALSTVEVVRASSQLLIVDILADIHLTTVDLHDSSARLFIRVRELDLSVETTRSKQRRIEDVYSVCSRYYFDVTVRLETVQLVQQLQHSTLYFTVSGFLRVESRTTN